MKKIVLNIIYMCFLSSFVLADNSHNKYIGMPVGGICSGQVYLGGDGQLWYWDIFNIAAISQGGHAGDRYYLNPLTQQKSFENGFGITITQGDKFYRRTLNDKGFSDISFEGKYPIGGVTYKDSGLPVEVQLKAYSPFVPTDDINSGLPLTVLEYTVTNTKEELLNISLSGWLQNMSCFQSVNDTESLKGAEHINEIVTTPDYTRLTTSVKGVDNDQYPDWGDMSLTLLEKGDGSAKASIIKGFPVYVVDKNYPKEATVDLGKPLVGCVSGETVLKKGETKTFIFLLSWYFPNVHLADNASAWKNKEHLRHYYSTHFKSSSSVSDYLISNSKLMETTKLWVDTWYDSTLPKWFLDRVFANVGTLATTSSFRFNDLTDDPDNEGRYYANEGVNLGPGTCTHVLHYEQVLGRVFPRMAKQHREQINLGLSFKDRIIAYRGEFSNIGHHDGRGHAVDGQAGVIISCYREHLMSSNFDFLEENWSNIKLAMQMLIDQDKEKTGKADGILEGAQYNTLDRVWYGKIAWTSGLYAAALKASAKMALEVGDRSFEKECKKISEMAYVNISKELFNGEYFIQKLDPKHPEVPSTNNGCHIDQILGQYWASQVGLDYILPKEQIRKSLKSILKYNFVDNYRDFLKTSTIPPKRWYAEGDEQGIIVCTFPHGGEDKAWGIPKSEWEKAVVGHFSKTFSGQEHAIASLLISEGMIEEGLMVEKAIHDRYSPLKRNPYNEIEYGNHYIRAMSSFAPFISALGFDYHGPKGVISFDPKVNPEYFKSAFITAEGWGTYSQNIGIDEQKYKINLVYGKLVLNQIRIPLKVDKSKKVNVYLNDELLKSKITVKEDNMIIEIPSTNIIAEDILDVRFVL